MMNTRLLERWAWPARFSLPPLVDEQTVQRIYQAASATIAPALLAQREVQHILLGERQSAFAGRGYEFADNQMYSPGDEARFINWRVLARTGQLYRKTFYEERRPQVWLLVDRSNSMRFGTRKRLKVAQASQLALFHLFLAQRRSLMTGAILLDSTPTWLQPTHDRTSRQALIQQLCKPCPPLAQESRRVGLQAILQQCQVRLPPGCIVILYSDFHELQANDMQLLHALGQQHTLYAWHVIDAAEQSLPAHGEYTFAHNEGTTSLNCSDAGLVARYQQQMQQRHDTVAGWFSQAGIEYTACRADAELFAAT